MISNPETAAKVAEFLLKIKAVKLSPSEPFTWASGIKSPIYCDNRVTLSYPLIRTFIRQQFVEVISTKYPNAEVVVGVATGGIAQGVLVAQELGLNFSYVRSSAKGHGMQNQIEGVVQPGMNAVVIEDLVSTGMSSLRAVDSLRDAGVNVKGMAAIFSYGFKESVERFEEKDCELSVLSDYDTLIQQALHSEYINEGELELLKAWREDPKNWNND